LCYCTATSCGNGFQCICYPHLTNNNKNFGPSIFGDEKENWGILTNKEICAKIKKQTVIETVRLNRLHWFGHVQRMEENRVPKKVLYMNLETIGLS
jgi:hypothetical protein